MIQRSERFQKAYDSLVRAFFEGTLAPGTCTACACGNIIADAVGKPLSAEEFQQEIHMYPETLIRPGIPEWNRRRTGNASSNGGRFEIVYQAKDEYKDVVNEAGYTTAEFATIETVFENAAVINYSNYSRYSEEQILEDQYEGLRAVIDVLLELEGDATGAEELKTNLRKHPKLVV
jgi:hypothetical protein